MLGGVPEALHSDRDGHDRAVGEIAGVAMGRAVCGTGPGNAPTPGEGAGR